MANKKIEIANPILDIFNEPYKFVTENLDGNPIPVDADVDKLPGMQSYKTHEGSTLELIERMFRQIPAWAFWRKDSDHIARIMAKVNPAKPVPDTENVKVLSLAEGDYFWLVGLEGSITGILDRQVPKSAQGETSSVDWENPEAIPTVGMRIWGYNESHFRETYLKAKEIEEG